MADRWTKFWLGVIALALCAIALRPLMPARDVNAQTPAAPAPARVSYQLVEASAAFKAEGQINALATQGWRAKSIASSAGAVVVLMEKTGP